MLWIFAVVFVACVGACLRGLQTIAPNRNYKSGTAWCLWRWTKVDSDYIVRLHVLKTPWWAVCLHWLKKPDAEPWLHDHPVSFLSIILRGAYTELRRDRNTGRLYHKVNRWFNFVRASYADRHRIILTRSNTLTLCFMGPKTREWGFHVWQELSTHEDRRRAFEAGAPDGWILWKRYNERLRAGEDMRRQSAWGELVGAVEKAANDKLAVRFCQVHGDPHWPVTLTDVESRVIDTAPALTVEEFYDEEPTEPRNG